MHRLGGFAYPCCADGVVGSIECDCVYRVAAPGEVLVGADDGHYLGVGIGDGEEDGVGTGLETASAVVGHGDILRKGGGGQC